MEGMSEVKQEAKIDWHEIFANVASSVDFLGDLTTTLIGLVSLIAFIRYRRKIAAAIRLLRINHVNDRINEIRKTLDLILAEKIPKGRAAELRGLFGRLNGQLVPLCALVPELHKIQEQVESIAHNSGLLNESIKQQISHEIIAQVESSKLLSFNKAVGSKE